MNTVQDIFSKYINFMSESLKCKNFSGYEVVRDMLDETIEEYKTQQQLCEQMNTNNFGVLNHLFEEALPTLLKTNKKAVKNVIKTIKEDKNLLSQFNFYNSLKTQYVNEKRNIMGDAYNTLDFISEDASKKLDRKTLLESNKKLKKVMMENNIIPVSIINEEDMSLYENGNIILTKGKKPSNLVVLSEAYDKVVEYMDKHNAKNINEDKKNPLSLIGDYEKQLKNNLSESEISFVKQITDFKTPLIETRKEKIFNKFKNECIEKVNEMINADKENVELKTLKEQLESQKYNNETIVKDIAKLLEIKDILMEEEK